MIEINLLPPEYRPVERTPLPRRLTIFAGVLLVCSTAAVCAWLMFITVPKARQALDATRQEADKKLAQKLEVENKKAEITSLNVRAEILRGLERERLPWAKLLDHLADARAKVDSVVLIGLDLKRGPAAGPAVAGRPREVSKLTIKGLVVSDSEPQSDELRKAYLRFVDALGKDKVFADMFEGEPQLVGDRVVQISASSGARGKDERMPKGGLEFEVVFTFKAPAPAQPGSRT